MIVRSKRPARFTVIDNDIVRNHSLSFKARGLLIYLLSMPDDWSVSSHHLASVGAEGRSAVRTGLTELVELGYLVRERRQDPETGRWGWVQTVYDQPVRNPVEAPVDNPSPEGRLPDFGKPALLRTTNNQILTEKTTRHTYDRHQICTDCNGDGWIPYGPSDVERCPRCEGNRVVSNDQ